MENDPVIMRISVMMMEFPVALVAVHFHIAAIEPAVDAYERVGIVRTAIAVWRSGRKDDEQPVVSGVEQGGGSELFPQAADGIFGESIHEKGLHGQSERSTAIHECFPVPYRFCGGIVVGMAQGR
jgi:hypothetical protein